MKLQYLILMIAVSMLMATCSKDKFTTKPKLELESINGSEFHNQSVLNFKFTLTDKEGDVNDTMWVQKVSLVCTEGNEGWPGAYKMPEFTTTKNLKVELDVNYCYNCGQNIPIPNVSGCTLRDDSCYFKFWLKDEAGNVSDTITTSAIKLLKD